MTAPQPLDEITVRTLSPVVVSVLGPIRLFPGGNPVLLVSGDLIRASNGHDDPIEIRYSGEERGPLVLDYRVAERPMRDDNKAHSPQPWIERVLAPFALAPRLEQLRRPNDMYAALADAARRANGRAKRRLSFTAGCRLVPFKTVLWSLVLGCK